MYIIGVVFDSDQLLYRRLACQFRDWFGVGWFVWVGRPKVKCKWEGVFRVVLPFQRDPLNTISKGRWRRAAFRTGQPWFCETDCLRLSTCLRKHAVQPDTFERRLRDEVLGEQHNFSLFSSEMSSTIGSRDRVFFFVFPVFNILLLS